MDQPKKKRTSTVVRGLLSGVILVYIVFALILTNNIHAGEKVRDVKVRIAFPANNKSFVTADNILSDLREVPKTTDRLKDIDLSALEHELKGMVNIESAEVTRNVDGEIIIDIVPMIPVARVFDRDGYSYYINREGKKLQANNKYHVDVPVIMGNVDDGTLSAIDLLPVLQYVSDDSLWNHLTSSFKVEANHDLILIPTIKGHVVNLGNGKDQNIGDKFERLRAMYTEVMPHKGWHFYDTISVKYRGQIVATRAKKRAVRQDLTFEFEDDEEVAADNMDISPAQ